MTNQRKKLLLALIFSLVLGCGLISYLTTAQLNTSVYPQGVPYKPSTVEFNHKGEFNHNGFVAVRVEVHTYFQTEDSIGLVTTHLDAEGWQKLNFDLVDGFFAFYNGYYPPRGTGFDVGPLNYWAASVVIPSYNEMTIIEEVSYIEIYFDLR